MYAPQPVLLKLFFTARMEQVELLTQLVLLRNLHLQKLTYYRDQVLAHIRGVVERHPHLPKDARLWEMTRRFGVLSDHAVSHQFRADSDLISRYNSFDIGT